MYATKEAIIAKEHDSHIQPTISILISAPSGQGPEAISTVPRMRAWHLLRPAAMVLSVKEVPGSHNLRLTLVTYEAGDGKQKPGEKY